MRYRGNLTRYRDNLTRYHDNLTRYHDNLTRYHGNLTRYDYTLFSVLCCLDRASLAILQTWKRFKFTPK